MARKVRQIPVTLDARGITRLRQADLAAILRGADPLITSGGRSLLSRILKGSPTRKIIDLRLDTCPAFGYFRHLAAIHILARIDCAFLNGYLALE